jgi:hypothetical protein
MAPVLRGNAFSPDNPPTNIAQLGMGWDVVTGTIDLGLGLYDAIIMVGEWIREAAQKAKKKNREEAIAQRGRRQPPALGVRELHTSSIPESSKAVW